jgi:predicted aconitase
MKTLRLTEKEFAILEGKQGEAARVALSVLVDLGELYGAEELIPVSQVHIDATPYIVSTAFLKT